jgi:hypothetical protein
MSADARSSCPSWVNDLHLYTLNYQEHSYAGDVSTTTDYGIVTPPSVYDRNCTTVRNADGSYSFPYDDNGVNCRWPLRPNSTARTCVCDPTRRICVPESVRSALLPSSAAMWFGIGVAAPAALALTLLLIRELLRRCGYCGGGDGGEGGSSGDNAGSATLMDTLYTYFSLYQECFNLGTGVTYLMNSQYANKTLLNLTVIFTCAPLLPYLWTCLPYTTANALFRRFTTHKYHTWFWCGLDCVGKIKAWPYWTGIWVWFFLWDIPMTAIIMLILGPILWKAEVLILVDAYKLWTGQDAARSTKIPAFGPRLYHSRVIGTLLLDSFPLLVLQVYNNVLLSSYGLYGWDKVAIVSATTSALSLAVSLWSLYGEYRRVGLNWAEWEMPSLNPFEVAREKYKGAREKLKGVRIAVRGCGTPATASADGDDEGDDNEGCVRKM